MDNSFDRAVGVLYGGTSTAALELVHLELLLEAEGLLIEERTAHASSPGQDRFRAA